MSKYFFLDPHPYEIDENPAYKDFFRCISEISNDTFYYNESCAVKDSICTSNIEHSNIITVLGGRGSGKTSFLLSVKEHIKKKNVEYYVINELIEPGGILDSNNILK